MKFNKKSLLTLLRTIKGTLMFLGLNYLVSVVVPSLYLGEPQQVIFIALFVSGVLNILLPVLMKKKLTINLLKFSIDGCQGRAPLQVKPKSVMGSLTSMPLPLF